MVAQAERFFDEFPLQMRAVGREMPDVPKAFGALFQTVMKDGALRTREKELVALGIGVAVRCVPCINSHVEKALQAGATREQVLEAASVAVMMQGGPSYTYLPLVVEALDALQQRSESSEVAPGSHADT